MSCPRFDGFGREACAAKGADIQFQNLAGARRRVQDSFQVDFAEALTIGEWDSVTRVFQKRHWLAHKMGVVDGDYLKKTNDPGAVIGRKVTVSSEEVTTAIGIVETLGKRLFDAVLAPS